MAKRIVIKLGTSVLTAGTRRLSRRQMLEIARQAAQLIEAGHTVAIVSSGAVAAGREALGYPKLGASVPAKQMLAAVGQARLMQVWSELLGIFDLPVGQVLLTRGDLAHRTGYLNARDTLLTLLAQGIVPVVNENDTVATDEIRVGDNDNLSALVANLLDADLLILLSDIEGLFSADPRIDPGAVLIPEIARIDEATLALAGGAGSGLGTGGMHTKLQAARLAGQSGATTVIARGDRPGVLHAIVAGDSCGTTFLPATDRRESRKRWLLAERPQGSLAVDSGAARKLLAGGASLLPVGLAAVDGEFERGAVVAILGPERAPLAAGIANYGAAELRQLIGLPSARIEATLGYSYGDEAVHRDNMAVLEKR